MCCEIINTLTYELLTNSNSVKMKKATVTIGLVVLESLLVWKAQKYTLDYQTVRKSKDGQLIFALFNDLWPTILHSAQARIKIYNL